jgi:hypothetical protein
MRIPALLAALVVTLALAGTAFAGASHAKFEFEGVTFSDGTNGTIYAASKRTGGGNTFTNCGYQATDGTFLGQYGDATFFSTDAGTLEQFCLDHYADRTA